MKRTSPSEPDRSPGPAPAGGTLIIVNPKAGAGKALRAARDLWSRLQDSSHPSTLALTERPGHATEVARDARTAGVSTVVAVGGDGTIQEIVTGLCLNGDGSVTAPTGKPPALALLPAGTGGDYRRTFGFTESVDQALARILSPRVVQVDIGRAELTSPSGQTAILAFANVLSFGIGGLTDRLVDGSPKWIGGTAAFYLGAVRATLVYQPVPVELWIDGKSIGVSAYSNVAVCLGRYFGGGMQIAPSADPADGTFEIVTIVGSRASVLALTLDIYRGTHFRRPGVALWRGSTVLAQATRPGEVLVDVDGEQPGTLPLAISLLPRALSLLT
jgi:diacylglycerol kinase (ATP)